MHVLLKPKKSLGQNFLRSEKVLQEFVDSCNLSKDDLVLEVGAGTGTITKELAKRAGGVIAVEFDTDLIFRLKESLREHSNVDIVNADVLSLFKNLKIEKLVEYWKAKIENLQFKIVGAIPYDITSPLIHGITFLEEKPKLIHLIIQKEVADKICATAPNASYLSNLVATIGTARVLKKVLPGSFYPAPKVYSSIVGITCYENPLDLDRRMFSDFLHLGFKFPRKKIKKVFGEETLSKAGINPELRPANLSFGDWVKLFLYNV
jgi:16S rRNA (adenine1518-N6/adenine1519-N6)-dimethyltransferase